MLHVEHHSSVPPCKAPSWALTGDSTRLPDFPLRALSSSRTHLSPLRLWQPVLPVLCAIGTRGKVAQRGPAVSEDERRQAEPQSAARAVSGQTARKGDASG